MRKTKLKPGQSAYNRLFSSNHYKEKGCSFELFMKLCLQDCHYCGTKPRLVNPYIKSGSKHNSQEWIDEQNVPFNGIDKKEHRDAYTDGSNLVPCCSDCNFAKQHMSHDEFIAHCQKVSKHQKRTISVDWLDIIYKAAA